jgi:hypothetical protein
MNKYQFAVSFHFGDRALVEYETEPIAFRVAREQRGDVCQWNGKYWQTISCPACGCRSGKGPKDCPECHNQPETPEQRRVRAASYPCGYADHLIENGLL